MRHLGKTWIAGAGATASTPKAASRRGRRAPGGSLLSQSSSVRHLNEKNGCADDLPWPDEIAQDAQNNELLALAL